MSIVLVEDEPELARLVVRELEAAGYSVGHAADGPTALRLFAESARPGGARLDAAGRGRTDRASADARRLGRPGAHDVCVHPNERPA
jgi:CheY-like chemotaxis protein